MDCANELSTGAGTAVMAAIASAKAILVNIVILLATKPEAASADQIAQLGLYSHGGIRRGFARSALRDDSFTSSFR
jgi:hypothetical protein